MSAKALPSVLLSSALALALPRPLVAAPAPPRPAAPAGDARGPAATAAAVGEPAGEQAVRGPGRWARELSRREAVLAAHRGRDPAAALALVGLLPELQGELPPGTLERFVDEVAGDRGRHPLVRAYAGMVRAQLYEEQGRLDEAQARLLAEGWLVRWQIAGPFDNAGRKGETEAHAPMTEPFSAAQVMLGKLPGEPLAWRHYDYEGIPRGGYVSFDDLLRPNEEVTGYATCWVHVPAATDAVLHVGTGGPYRAWVGTTEVGHGDAYRTPHPLQDAHPVKLAAGWNRLLVKTSAQQGMWGFFARVSLRSGAPIAELRSTAEPPEGAPVAAPGASSGESPTTQADTLSLRGLLERRYPGRDSDAKRPGPASAGLELVELYRWIQPFDTDDRALVELATRVDGRVKSARSAWLRALVDRDQTTSRRALDEAVVRARAEGSRSAPLLGQLLLEVAWRERTLGLEHVYRSHVKEAQAAAPDDPMVALARIDELADDGYPWLAVATLRKLIERFPTSSTLRRDLAGRLRGQGRTEEALEALASLARDRGTTEGLAPARIEALLELGRPDEAAEVARGAAQATPGVPDVHARLAEVELARGDIPAARAALAQAIALAPQAAELHASMGSLLLRSGAQPAAVAAFERSLQLRPQQPELRDLLASLGDGQGGDDLLARFGVELDEVGAVPTPASWKGKDAGVLHHRVVVRVLPNGLTERLDHRIIRVLDDRGIGSQAVQAMVYDPAESTVDVRRARVRRKDGTIEELGDTQVYGLASAGYRMYYDQRQISVQFPGLRVGDTLEVAFLRRDVAARNMFDEYFGDLMPLQGSEPRRHVEYVLVAPSDKPLYFNQEVERSKSKDGKTTTYRLVAKDVPGIKPEAAMPGWTEVARFLHVSTYKSWDDVGRWYWNLVREQLVVDDEIRRGVKDAVAKLPAGADARAKVAAIYEHVVRNTRYVGLEFGIHGYKPYRTTDVYSRRFGDCKDKASLLKVMLAEVGIDSHLVLVRTRDLGTLPDEPASLAAFNHAITYVPSLDLFLDGTAEWSGPAELPSSDQGATVLVVEDGKGAKLRTIPMSGVDENGRRTQQRVALKADGTASVEHAVTVWGGGASSVRYRFQSPKEREERLAAAFGDVYPGVEVADVEAPGLGDILRPAELRAKLSVPRWATDEGQALRFTVLGRESRLAAAMAGTAEREHDLVLDLPSTEDNEIRYVLPAGHKFSRMPAGKQLDTPVGKFSLEVTPQDDGAVVRSRLQLTRPRITPAEYDAFRQFLRQVDASLEQSFEVTSER